MNDTQSADVPHSASHASTRSSARRAGSKTHWTTRPAPFPDSAHDASLRDLARTRAVILARDALFYAPTPRPISTLPLRPREREIL